MSNLTSGSIERNILLRLHPLQRILLSFIITCIVAIPVYKSQVGILLSATILWDTFAIIYITTCWIVFFNRTQPAIVKVANIDDGSRIFVLISILATALASLFAVLFLLLSNEYSNGYKLLPMMVAVAGMMLSWIMVHTLFTFHYAHMYYEKNGLEKLPELNFPADKKPDYLDFAYFSFVIGMTFQVSDVEVATKRMRKTVLAHSLLAFALNTFVVALTINLIAGLRN